MKTGFGREWETRSLKDIYSAFLALFDFSKNENIDIGTIYHRQLLKTLTSISTDCISVAILQLRGRGDICRDREHVLQPPAATADIQGALDTPTLGMCPEIMQDKGPRRSEENKIRPRI